MPDVLAALDAFLQEHRRCGDLDAGMDGEHVWMACTCRAGAQGRRAAGELNFGVLSEADPGGDWPSAWSLSR